VSAVTMSARGAAPRAASAPATTVERPRVLCVDDEANVLAALSRTLRAHYDVVTAESAEAGLAQIAAGEPFAVVVSDLRMPGTDGVAFLAAVRELAPDTVRVLLTGNADLAGAISAVNEGQLFRFLVKPCAPEALLNALDAATQQHRLITAERVLLEQTVHGSIKALTDLLAIVQPASFGRATRLRRHVEALAIDLGLPDRWQVEVAALLSQVGYIVVPADLAERVDQGRPLTRADQDLLARLPRLAEQLVASIPRLEAVRAILLHQSASFASEADVPAALADVVVPIGARLLRVAQDFDVLETQGMTPAVALDVLDGRTGLYDPAVLAALRRVCGVEIQVSAIGEMRLADVQLGMIFASDVVTANGLLLVARGQEVTAGLLERIWAVWYSFATNLRVSMILSGGAAFPAPQPAASETRR
jgi:response regulator RpfG family c-di-GMP phosphodiesterase